MTGRYQKTTDHVRVSVESDYLDEQSTPEDGHYVWAYHITIDNLGEEPVRLLNRYWHITDALGRIHEVRGAGVVGEQPVLAPGESYEYTSGTPLGTSSGIMRGSYEMETGHGKRLEVEIPAFSLDMPQTNPRLN